MQIETTRLVLIEDIYDPIQADHELQFDEIEPHVISRIVQGTRHHAK